MPTPTIPDGELFFNATTYTGNGGTLTVTNGVAGQSFQPDFVWVKRRNGVSDHYLSNSIGGANKNLYSNRPNAEVTDNSGGYLSSFNSNGFTAITGSTNANETNSNNDTYVGWQWKAGGAAVTNTSGTISSQVSSNPTSGFSVVTYTGNTINGATVGHGLLVGGVTTAPSMIIVKNRSTSTLWAVYHASVGAASVAHLDDTAAFSASGDWNSVTPTPTLFTIGTSNRVNNANNYVAYCWAPVAGYSAFGSYTGNGSTDGPFVYTGFRPRFVMFKKSSGVDDWEIIDTSRNTYNVNDEGLAPNSSAAEISNRGGDILSNGFKLRFANGTTNESGQTYIYMAFAENPFKYANAR